MAGGSLVPRIQIPLAQAKVKAAQIIRSYQRQFPNTALVDLMEPVIDEMAVFFCGSRFAAKIHMVDFSYEKAVGTLT